MGFGATQPQPLRANAKANCIYSISFIITASKWNALNENRPGQLIHLCKNKALECKNNPEQLFYAQSVVRKTTLHNLLPSRLYCRLRSFTESTLRLVGYTTGRELHPALKFLFYLRTKYICLSVTCQVFFILCSCQSTAVMTVCTAALYLAQILSSVWMSLVKLSLGIWRPYYFAILLAILFCLFSTSLPSGKKDWAAIRDIAKERSHPKSWIALSLCSINGNLRDSLLIEALYK